MKKKYFSLIILVFVVFLLTGCSFNLFASPYSTESIYTEATTIDTTKTLDERVQQIAKDYVSAVVTVFVVDGSDNEISFGSGVGIYEGGYIVTNYHVVSSVIGSSTYSLVVYYNDDATPYDAEVLWSHANLDLAIIKSENPNLPFVEMEDRSINPAEGNGLNALETVIAIGTPIDFSLQNSITLGYISSASARVAISDDNVYEDLIQHTAPINHGNSGGALFDSYGKLIGLNTLGNDDANSIFFSVPIYGAMLVIDDIASAYESNSTYTTPALGINGEDRYQADYLNHTFTQSGMKVTSVSVTSPAYLKLQVNDIITSITVGSTTYNIDLRNDLIFALLNSASGQTISVGYIRSGISGSVNVTLG